ncbi:SDR family NAD(P)-dependent oxidoreductase [Hoeflea sp.]|uniref:SDR family NAD(P)-dependent oxidoreductase n=1 Tax=Hoeflea sp. TaxID=1940281 RepID=UPI003A92F6B7
MSRVAVISGGAGGLGQAFAAHLLKEDWRVVLIDLPAALAVLPTGDERIEQVACDLTDEAAVAAVCADISVRYPALDLVIHNAGVTQIDLFDETTLASQRLVMEINYFGSVRVAAGLLQAVRRGRGTHIAVSSVAGFAPLNRRTAYAASKHAMNGFFQSLATEEAEYGVGVVVAAPSFVATNPGRFETGIAGIGRPGAATDGFDEISPAQAAKTILDGWRRGKRFVPVGRVAWMAWMINRLSPGLYIRLMRRKIRNS